MVITVSARELLDAGHWGDYCEKYGVWEWAINEGLMDDDHECEIELGDAIIWGFAERP